MRSRAIIPLVVGLGIGILAIKIFADVLKKAKGSGTGNEIVQVVCASTDIAPTVELKESMLELKPWPRAMAPKLTAASKDELVGRVTSMGIPRGLPVVANLLAPKGTPPGMATRIREGYRAVAVQVDEIKGVAGWIKPGSRVDVVAVFQAEDNSNRRATVSKVVLDNIEVLAVGQDLGSAGETNAAVAKSVTLLVRPEEVPKLHLASTKGTIRLAMRNQQDYSVSNNSETTDNALLDRPADTQPAFDLKGKAKIQSSFLARLLEAQRKMADDKTDKDNGAPAAQNPAPAPPVAIASAEQKPGWRVEVMTGSDAKDIWFEGDSKGAKRVLEEADAKVKSGSRRNTSLTPKFSPLKTDGSQQNAERAPEDTTPELRESSE